MGGSAGIAIADMLADTLSGFGWKTGGSDDD